MKATSDVVFVTGNDLLRLYSNPIPPALPKRELAEHFRHEIDFLSTVSGDLSAADVLLELLDLPVQFVDGPSQAATTTLTSEVIPDYLFEASIKSARSFIETNHRLPSQVFVGSQSLSLSDFAATLSHHVLSPGPIHVVKGRTAFEKYFSKDARASFNWPIHPDGFAPEELLTLARLQGWTLKPARLR